MGDKIDEEALFIDKRQIELIKETEKRHEPFLNMCGKMNAETEKETHKLNNEDYHSLFEDDRTRDTRVFLGRYPQVILGNIFDE